MFSSRFDLICSAYFGQHFRHWHLPAKLDGYWDQHYRRWKLRLQYAAQSFDNDNVDVYYDDRDDEDREDDEWGHAASVAATTISSSMLPCDYY